MNRSTATWLVLLSAWTLAGAAKQNTDADADMTEEEIAEAIAEYSDRLATNLIGPSAFCTSYTDNGERWIYLTGVFAVDLAAWRNMEEDRPATQGEVMSRFEHEYTAWLKPRYEGVWRYQTHCRLFSLGRDAAERRMQDIEDFRELGHRVVETDWTPAP